MTSRDRPEAVIIITTKLEEQNLKYESSKLLEKEEDISIFIKSIPDLGLPNDANGFKNWIRTQKNIRGGNKCLGSTGGLMNSVPYVAQLSDKNLGNFEKKAEKMDSPKKGWKTKPEFQDKLTKNMRDIYLTFWKKNKPDKEKIANAFLFILLPEELDGLKRKEIYKYFSKDRLNEWENDEHCTKKERPCPVCGKTAILGITDDATYQDKKPFIKRYGRPDSYLFRICNSCMTKYLKAKRTLAMFRIFPLFKKRQIPEGMTFIDDDGKAKKFSEIIEKMKALTKQEEFDFELIGIGKDGIWLYDYITGYKPYFSNGYSRFNAERDVWSALGIEKSYPYFDDNPKIFANKSGKIQVMAYEIREKIFNFVYRGNDEALKREDITNALDANIHSILTEIKKPEKRCADVIKSAIRIMDVLRWKNMEITKKDQENAINLGRAFRKVTGLSEAGNKYNLLNLALDKPKVDGVKSVLARLLDKFNHKFGELKPNDQKLISECLKAEYDADRFDPLKVYFYAGYFEVNE